MNLYQDQHQQYIPSTVGPNFVGPLSPFMDSNPHSHLNSQMPPRPFPTETGTMQWADVYAPAFVPSFYIQINNMPAITVKSHPPPSIDYPAYISAFAGTAFLKPLLPCPALQPVTMGEGYPLTYDTYFRYFSDLLYRELSSQHENVRQYNMYNVPLQHYDSNLSQFKLMVPGIREDCPMVAVGDVVHLRQIRTNGFNAYPPVGFTGLQYEAYIYAIDRQTGSLILRIDKLILESGLFNVTFLVQEEFQRPHTRALFDISKLLSSNRQGFARKILFPEQSDGIQQTTLSEGKFSHKWFDDELNYEQQKAVDAIIQQKYGALPYLISGPPGTGKTKTIVEAALQLIFGQAAKNHHIILCAPSNQAADTLTQRLIPHLNPGTLLRLNSCSRSFAEVPIELLTYCYVRNNSFGLPDWRKLMTYKVIVATCKDCSMLVEARCTNRDLARWEKVVTASLRGEELPTLFNGMDVGNWTSPGATAMGDIKLHWSALLIDEAAQGTEPEILIPVSVIVPPEEYSKQSPVFVMAGDQKQLGPRTASRRAFLETSLFERLFSRQLYSEHPLSRKQVAKIGGANVSKWINERSTSLPYIRPPFTNLIRNYRSHSAILAVPSALFYHDTLVPEATDVNGMEKWEGWKGRKWPVLFMTNGGQDELHGEGVSFYNLREMKLACKTAKSLVESGLLKPHEIAIMSPFREQVRRIRNTLRLPENGLRDVNVGPLEAFQGSEHKFVIICTTRSRERFLEQDNQKGLGIIFESKKFNVAMTRAKQGLVVIGNPWILQKDPVWLAFLSFCWRNGIVEHDSEEPEPSIKIESTTTDLSNPSAFQNGNLQKESNPLSREARPGFAFNANSTNVNLWEPPKDEQDMPQYLSRLEQGLLTKDHLAGFNGYTPSPLGAEFSGMDDPMWTAGIVAEDAMRGVDLDSLHLE